MLMSVSFKKTTLTLTHDAAPNVKGLKLSLNKVKPQLISLLDHAPKKLCFSSSLFRRDLCVFCREPGDGKKKKYQTGASVEERVSLL